MQDIAPFFQWLEFYVSEEDENSPFFDRKYSRTRYTQQIYNYLIHPQWDFFGSPTLFCKVLFADYKKQFIVIELFGEWNDAIHNDIMHFKRKVAEPFMESGIHKFALITENVLNFHASDDSYYQEWQEEVMDTGGWLVALNVRDHLVQEMSQFRITDYLFLNNKAQQAHWRKVKPQQFSEYIEKEILSVRG